MTAKKYDLFRVKVMEFLKKMIDDKKITDLTYRDLESLDIILSVDEKSELRYFICEKISDKLSDEVSGQIEEIWIRC